MKPPGLETLRGSAETPNISAAEFAAKAEELERELWAHLDGAAREPVSAGYFVLPFRAKTTMSVVVISVPKSGSARRLYPALDDPRPIPQRARFAAGDHVLPGPRIELNGAQGASASVSYHRGFLVPVGAREMRVIFAARKAPLEEETLAAIDEALGRASTQDELEAVLAARGFTLEERTILEPKD